MRRVSSTRPRRSVSVRLAVATVIALDGWLDETRSVRLRQHVSRVTGVGHAHEPHRRRLVQTRVRTLKVARDCLPRQRTDSLFIH
jgi:hypothetical protein